MFVTGNVKIGEKFYLHHVILLVLVILALLSQLLKGKLTIPERFNLCFLFFLASTSLTFFSNVEVSAFRSYSQLIIFFLGIFLTYLCITNRDDYRHWLHVIILGCATNAVVGLYQSFAWIKENGFVLIADGQWFRVKGLCVSPADYALQLIVGLILSSTIKSRAWRGGGQVTYIVLMLLSMSRSAFVTLVLLGVVTAFGMQSKKRIFQFSLLGLVLMFMGGFYMFDDNPVFQRFIDIGNMDMNLKRIVVFQDVKDKILSGVNVFLFGNGFGTYSFFHPIDLEVYDNPHNIFLHIFYSAGLMGFIAFLLCVAALITSCYSLWRVSDSRQEMKTFLGAILCLHMCVWIIGLVEQNISGVGAGWLIGAIFGAPLVLRKMAWVSQQCEY